jgi:integrase
MPPASIPGTVTATLTAILIAYRHGLRASELYDLIWNMIELDSGRPYPCAAGQERRR